MVFKNKINAQSLLEVIEKSKEDYEVFLTLSLKRSVLQ